MQDTTANATVGDSARGTVLALHAAIAEATGVALPLRLWDGSETGNPQASFRIVLRHPWSARMMLSPADDVAAGEAYVHGAVDVEGDMVAAIEAGAQLSETALSLRDRLGLRRLLKALPRPPRIDSSRRARLRGRLHSTQRDRQAISFHYDLPQTFYEGFLDQRLVYSCAYYLDPDESLDDAQRRKLDVLCRKLRLTAGERLLDIGCGWGSLLIHAASHYGVRGVGVTLSQTQADAAVERVAAAGLADRVEIRLADYRDLDERFDKVASVGMFEHVGPDRLSQYFSTVWNLVRPGGLFCNHGIVTGEAERVSDHASTRTFIGRYVFPDGGLVPVWRTVREFQRPGFTVLDVEQLRPHYALTLRAWVRRLETNHAAAVGASSEADYRIWRAYMAGSAVGFERGHLGVVQVLGAKPEAGGRPPALPLGRAWMLPG